MKLNRRSFVASLLCGSVAFAETNGRLVFPPKTICRFLDGKNEILLPELLGIQVKEKRLSLCYEYPSGGPIWTYLFGLRKKVEDKKLKFIQPAWALQLGKRVLQESVYVGCEMQDFYGTANVDGTSYLAIGFSFESEIKNA
jgi:hypothetical protein